MGDRANFVFKQGNDHIYVYGHNAGYQMMDQLAHAIKRVIDAGRQHDESYATRIAVSELVDNSSDLGWGLSTYLTDNEHSVPVVDWRNQTVSLYPKGDVEFTSPNFTMSLGIFVNKFLKQNSWKFDSVNA